MKISRTKVRVVLLIGNASAAAVTDTRAMPPVHTIPIIRVSSGIASRIQEQETTKQGKVLLAASVSLCTQKFTNTCILSIRF